MKKTVSKIFIVCVLFIGASTLQSCKTASILKTSPQNYAKTKPTDIEVFMSKKPTRKYTEIGTVTSSKNVGIFSRTQEKTYKELKEKAASIGGHAIINLTEDNQSVKGVVIRYTE